MNIRHPDFKLFAKLLLLEWLRVFKDGDIKYYYQQFTRSSVGILKYVVMCTFFTLTFLLFPISYPIIVGIAYFTLNKDNSKILWYNSDRVPDNEN